MSVDSLPAPREHIFISYRRDDARGASGRIYDWLKIAFGKERVFRDVHSIGVGKWRDRIDAALAKSTICVAVIGPRWFNEENLSRLHDAGDMVRHELLTSLGSTAITMVPTLVEGVELAALRGVNLPADLRPLLDVWNARQVTEDGWEEDIRRLIGEIAEASRLAVGPDVDTLLRNVAAAQARAAELEQTRQLQSDQIEALHRTVEELRGKLAEASAVERPGLARAFEELARGNSLAAEDAFEREYDAQTRVQAEARHAGAEAARNVANLALLRDVSKAVSFYRKALDAEPSNAATARLLGNASIVAGDLKGAEAAFSEAMRIVVARQDPQGEFYAHIGLGDVYQTSKNLPAAMESFMAARRLAENGMAIDPANTQWQRSRSVSLDRMGIVLLAQGDAQGALDVYRTGLEISRSLAAADPENTQLQRDLTVSHCAVGDVLVMKGERTNALIAFRESLDNARKLALQDPTNATWQRDLSTCYNKIGQVLEAQNDRSGALVVFRQSLEIREKLAARDPANTEWQRDVSVSHERIGGVLMAQGDGPGALAVYRQGLGIAEALAARDPGNTNWQRDLALSYNTIGNVLESQGDLPGALADFRRSLEIARQLVLLDTTNAVWQSDLSVCLMKIGRVLRTQGDGAAALVHFKQAQEVLDALLARAPANFRWERDRAYNLVMIGESLMDAGDLPGALANFRQALDIRETLAARDPTNAELLGDLSVCYNKIGNLLAAQGDAPGAVAALQRDLEISEALFALDPEDPKRRADVVISLAALGRIAEGQAAPARRQHLVRGRDLSRGLDSTDQGADDRQWADWFDAQIAALDAAEKQRDPGDLERA